jgi:hypothetical protein
MSHLFLIYVRSIFKAFVSGSRNIPESHEFYAENENTPLDFVLRAMIAMGSD